MSKTVGIIDIGSGNLFSLVRSIKSLNVKIEIIEKKEQLKLADSLLIPGVGSFKSGMDTIKNSNIYDELKNYNIKGKPILGICLGMQLLLTESEEFGLYKGLNFIPGKVKPIPKTKKWPVPNIGWSEIIFNKKNLKPFSNVIEGTDFYFIHSYYCDPVEKSHIIAEIDYGGFNIPAVINHENIYGCQFHPELSDKYGFKILSDFIELI